MRILSVDYGKKRCGLAVTDPLQIIANGLVTVATCDLFDYLSAYIQKEEVERIVIGKPTQLSGKPSENLARVEQFVNRWRKTHPEIPIVFYDERFTSVLAEKNSEERTRDWLMKSVPPSYFRITCAPFIRTRELV